MERRHNTRHAAALAAAAAASEGSHPQSSQPQEEKVHQSSSSCPATFSSSSSSSSPTSVPIASPGHPVNSTKMSTKRDMYESFQTWALKTYGDSAKTKTVTRRKYNRILKILKGEEQTNAENSKFRFWVKAKGFRIGPPSDHISDIKRNDQVLYIPCSKILPGNGKEDTVYKKVAVVENFFDIIYGVHVEMDGRGGKHAGQKRTYKAIAEMYSFLPREAVTHFLMSCADCQKRMHLANDSSCSSNACGGKASLHGNVEQQDESAGSSSSPETPGYEGESLHIDYSLPITTTYLKHMRSLGYTEEDALNPDREENLLEYSFDCTPVGKVGPGGTLPKIPRIHRRPALIGQRKRVGLSGSSPPIPRIRPALNTQDDWKSRAELLDSEDVESEISEEPNIPSSQQASTPNYEGQLEEVGDDGDQRMAESSDVQAASESVIALDMRHVKQENGHIHWTTDEPINMTKGDYSTNHQDHSYERTMSPCNGCVKREASATPDNLSAGTKDEDDEDDDDDTDKIDMNKYDPERLKAFNMFVRLFVDENLDRMVPISRQPKDKIQAIIDSCARQFPEFGERARKRIRTYLKSCRRNKRTRENSNWELGRTSHPHLTSALAEQILASACENESQNAKRMRLGLKPIAVSLAEVERGRVTSHASGHLGSECDARTTVTRSPQHDNILQAALRHGRPPPTPSTASASATMMNGVAYTQESPTYTATYRLVPNSTNHSTAAQPTSNGHQGAAHSAVAPISNGPTDLSMKKCGNNPPNNGKYSLNPNEVVAVKQLIAGYRESAAFLLRSADELEQLLLQQN